MLHLVDVLQDCAGRVVVTTVALSWPYPSGEIRNSVLLVERRPAAGGQLRGDHMLIMMMVRLRAS